MSTPESRFEDALAVHCASVSKVLGQLDAIREWRSEHPGMTEALTNLETYLRARLHRRLANLRVILRSTNS
ncbi:MAG: hypothetical protein OXU36_10700 [Candidatus Poribacteria bacterium]|nr:hypothetical protein [Candidatus Poribacteria bacterium]